MNLEQPHICPGCGSNLDGNYCADGSDRVPQPGDLTICCDCGVALVYEGTTVRFLSLLELVALPKDDQEMLSTMTAIWNVGRIFK